MSLGPESEGGWHGAPPCQPVLNLPMMESGAEGCTWAPAPSRGPVTDFPGVNSSATAPSVFNWTWWTELKDFHVSLNISGLGPGAGAEDKRLQGGAVVTPCPLLEGQIYAETQGCRPPQGMGTDPRWGPGHPALNLQLSSF